VKNSLLCGVGNFIFVVYLAVAIKREYVTLRMNASVYICCVIAFKREECACRTALEMLISFLN